MTTCSDLKPCPFCGGNDLRQYSFRAALDVYYAVQCYCGARSEGWIQRDAVEKWNARKPFDDLKSENESLREDAARYRNMRAATLKQVDDTPDEFDAEFDHQLSAAMSDN